MYFSSNLEWIRKKKNLTQEELAKKLGISQQGIAHYESGKREPTLDGLISIAKVLEVSIDDLLTKDFRSPDYLLASNLKYLRKKFGLDIKEMARMLGYKEPSLYGAAEGGRDTFFLFSTKRAMIVSEFFGVTVDDLLKKDLSKEG